MLLNIKNHSSLNHPNIYAVCCTYLYTYVYCKQKCARVSMKRNKKKKCFLVSFENWRKINENTGKHRTDEQCNVVCVCAVVVFAGCFDFKIDEAQKLGFSLKI